MFVTCFHEFRIYESTLFVSRTFSCFQQKTLRLDKVDDKAPNTVKFATFEPLTATERLSTVSSPYMVFDEQYKYINTIFTLLFL